MKKVLFYAGLLALATACSEEEFLSSEGQNNAKGITFVTADAETRMQWDETTSSYVPFWYAEQDRIGLFGLQMKKGAYSSQSNLNVDASGDGWSKFTSGSAIGANATYKATQSKKNGVFTSTDDANTLWFNGNKTARVLAVYPSTVKAEYSASKGKIVLSALPVQSTQTQATTKGQNEAIMMYDLTTASKVNSYDAVGENVQLAFQRPMSAIVFKTANANAYVTGASPVFGALKTITVETKGYDGNDDGDSNGGSAEGDIAPTMIAYDNTTAALEVDTLTKAATFVPGAGTEASKVVLTLGTGAGLPWNDDALAIASVKNVDRKAFRNKNVKEAISVVYSFTNIEIESKTKEVSVDFNGFMNFPALNINDYDYLVTLGAANTRTLIVNKGSFSDIFDLAGDIKWKDSQSGASNVAVSEVQTIIINSGVEPLTDEEFAKLNSFGAQVISLTLNCNTEIKKNALNNLTGLTKIDMQNVTTIGEGAFAANLATVILPAYNFEDLAKNPMILKTASLTYLDMRGVSVMNAGFPAKGLSLQGYTNLQTVVVKDGLKVGANAFNGCTALETVKGAVELVGTAAFKGCNNANFTTINITNTDIPANTFENCSNLANIKKGGKQVIPTSVGSQAFKSCAKLKVMDLSNAAEIGQQAFMDCAMLVGNEKVENDKNVLYVGATEINDNAFAGCKALEYVYFKNATKFGLNILGTTATYSSDGSGEYALKEIKFGEAFTPKAGVPYTGTEFGGATKVAALKLFVNPAQDVNTINDNKLVLPAAYSSGTVTATVDITFASITKEPKY